MSRKNIDYTNWSKDELIKELKRIKETTYGLVWHRDVPQEKIDVLINPDARTPEEMFANEVAGKPFPVLKEVKGKEVISDKKDQTHILIEGDNFHSLAVLNFTHQEAIDVIYIDPPYNTGNNDFIYNDKIKSSYVKKDDPFRHSKWLSFMEKRLKVAKNVLKKGGSIFISIDDNEYAPLKMLCDEIFSETNLLGTFIWESKLTGGHDSKHINVVHEYVLCYAKDATIENVINKRKTKTEYPHFDKAKNKYFKWDSLWTVSHGYTKNCDYPIKAQDGTEVFPWMCHKDFDKVKGIARWFWSKETYKSSEKDDILVKKTGGKWKVYKKVYGGSDVPFKSIFEKEIVGGTSHGKDELENIFGKLKVFDNPKPTALIKQILKIGSLESSIILDFMAGSGTTGHAVLDLNKEDGGNRKFILCTNNENNIATDVCQSRLQKVMKGYKSNKGEKVEGLGGNLKYYTAYDFVESEPSDKNKHKLVNKCTEMLCIKEGVYDLVSETDDYKILKSNDDRYLGIIFYEDAIDEYKKAIKKIDAQLNTYVFSLGDDPHTAQFADVADKVALQAIPEIILKVYQEIFK